MEFQVNSELIAMAVGGLISFVFSIVPGLNTKFAALKEEIKKIIMLLLMASVSVVIYFGACNWGWFTTDLVCGQAAVWRLVTIFVAAAVGNQGIFRITPQTRAVLAAKID